MAAGSQEEKGNWALFVIAAKIIKKEINSIFSSFLKKSI